MSDPIVLISRSRIKEGKLDDWKQSTQEVFKLMEATKPGTVAHLAYLSEDGGEMTVIHVFPDAKSMDLHMEGVDERVKKAYEFVETTRYEIYGRPSEVVLGMMKQFAGSRIPLSVEPEYLGGYIRLKSS